MLLCVRKLARFFILTHPAVCDDCHADNVRHLAVLKELGIVMVPPISKVLACGDRGVH